MNKIRDATEAGKVVRGKQRAVSSLVRTDGHDQHSRVKTAGLPGQGRLT